MLTSAAPHSYLVAVLNTRSNTDAGQLLAARGDDRLSP